MTIFSNFSPEIVKMNSVILSEPTHIELVEQRLSAYKSNCIVIFPPKNKRGRILFGIESGRDVSACILP